VLTTLRHCDFPVKLLSVLRGSGIGEGGEGCRFRQVETPVIINAPYVSHPHPFSLSNRTVAPLFFTPLVRGTELFLYFQHRHMISRRRSAPCIPAVCRHTASHSPLHISFFPTAYTYVRMYGTFNRIDFQRYEASSSIQNDRNECTSFICTQHGSLYVELRAWLINLLLGSSLYGRDAPRP